MSFWTVCPYCLVLYQYEKKYEECSLRCQNCRRAFHGASVDPPAPEAVVSGKDQYYCYHTYLPVRYPSEKEAETKRWKERANRSKNMPGEDFSDISEGVGGQSNGFQAGEAGPYGKERFEGVHGGLGKNAGEGVQGSGNTGLQSKGKRQMKMKTVAKSTKKISGNKFRFG